MPRDRGGREHGFSALEAICAVAILGIASLPLMQMQASATRALQRVEIITDRHQAEYLARHYVSTLNLSDTTDETISLGGGWSAYYEVTRSSSDRFLITGISSRSRFSFATYDVAVVLRSEKYPSYSFQLRHTQWDEHAPFSEPSL